MSTKVTAFGKTIEVNAPQTFGFGIDGLVEDLDRALVRLEFSIGESGEPVCNIPRPASAPEVVTSWNISGHESFSDILEMWDMGWLTFGRSLAQVNQDFASADPIEQNLALFGGGQVIVKRVEEQDGDRHYIFTLREGTWPEWKIGTEVFSGSEGLRKMLVPPSIRVAKPGDTRNTLTVFGEKIEVGQRRNFHFGWEKGLVQDEKASSFRLTFYLNDEGLPVCATEGNAFAVCFAQEFSTNRFFHSDAVFAGSSGCERAIVLCGGAHYVEKLAVRSEDGVDHYEFVLNKGAPFDIFAHEMPRQEVAGNRGWDLDEPYWRRYY